MVVYWVEGKYRKLERIDRKSDPTEVELEDSLGKCNDVETTFFPVHRSPKKSKNNDAGNEGEEVKVEIAN